MRVLRTKDKDGQSELWNEEVIFMESMVEANNSIKMRFHFYLK